jgi:pimeloyl-ACP methyl ester carboxylesterase
VGGKMPHIVFSHGKESGPWGGKIRYLSAIAGTLGCTFDSLDYQGKSAPEQRVDLLTAYLKNNLGSGQEQVVLVGSSMGACVSVEAAQRFPVAGLFLLAPALGLADGWDLGLEPIAGEVAVTHGWQDEIIPVQMVYNWCHRYHCTLHCVADSHRLLKALPEIGQWFRDFILAIVKEHSPELRI